MNNTILPPFICPVCSEPLRNDEPACRCVNGHSFDVAREGYLNLLLSHQRRSGHPGDDQAMIRARRRFFDSGAFDPLTEYILHAIPDHATVLDAGCGEGHIPGTRSETQSGPCIGIDISKEAVRCAAKRYKKVQWAVANIMRSIPLADYSIDVILSILAPRNPAEFARILRPDGRLLLGVPGPNHLIELRERLTETAGDFMEKADDAVTKSTPFFQETGRQVLTEQQNLSAEQIADLIQMTPIFWNSSPQAKAAVQQLPGLSVTISFTLITLSKKSSFPLPSPIGSPAPLSHD